MKTIEITEENALKAASLPNGATPKEIIDTLCGKKLKLSTDIRDHINSMADAYKMHPTTEAQRKVLDLGHDSAAALVDMEIFTKAMNTDPVTGKVWEPDYDNTSQKKWEIYWINKPGVGFVFGNSFYVRDVTGVGSRLVFETQEKAKHAANTPDFVKAYNRFSPSK